MPDSGILDLGSIQYPLRKMRRAIRESAIAAFFVAAPRSGWRVFGLIFVDSTCKIGKLSYVAGAELPKRYIVT
jgi:hypothetical protein